MSLRKSPIKGITAPKFKIKEDRGTRYIVGAKRTRLLKEYRKELTAKGYYPSWNVKKGKITMKKEAHNPALPIVPKFKPPAKIAGKPVSEKPALAIPETILGIKPVYIAIGIVAVIVLWLVLR